MLAEADYKLLQLRWISEGDSLYVLSQSGYPLSDSQAQTLINSYQPKINALLENWNRDHCVFVGKTKDHLIVKGKEKMANICTGNGLVLTASLTELMRSWIDSDTKYGLVRLYNKRTPIGLEEAQLTLSVNNDDLIWTLGEAVGKKRSDYVEPADLDDLRRLYNQTDQFEFTFRSIHKRPGNQTAFFTNRYSLFEDEEAVYQISQRVDYRLVSV